MTTCQEKSKILEQTAEPTIQQLSLSLLSCGEKTTSFNHNKLEILKDIFSLYNQNPKLLSQNGLLRPEAYSTFYHIAGKLLKRQQNQQQNSQSQTLEESIRKQRSVGFTGRQLVQRLTHLRRKLRHSMLEAVDRSCIEFKLSQLQQSISNLDFSNLNIQIFATIHKTQYYLEVSSEIRRFQQNAVKMQLAELNHSLAKKIATSSIAEPASLEVQKTLFKNRNRIKTKKIKKERDPPQKKSAFSTGTSFQNQQKVISQQNKKNQNRPQTPEEDQLDIWIHKINKWAEKVEKIDTNSASEQKQADQRENNNQKTPKKTNRKKESKTQESNSKIFPSKMKQSISQNESPKKIFSFLDFREKIQQAKQEHKKLQCKQYLEKEMILAEIPSITCSSIEKDNLLAAKSKSLQERKMKNGAL